MIAAASIRNDDDLRAALKRIEELWHAEIGTPEGDELEALLDVAHAYEQAHHRITPPPEAVVRALEEDG